MATRRKRRPLSPEARARMSAAQKGKTLSAEHRAKLSAALKGRTRSPEHSANIAAALKGRKLSAEHRAKLSAAHKGRSHSPEARAKISAANRRQAPRIGWTHSPEARAKISAAKRGRPRGPLSAEARAKISAALKGRELSPEHRARISAGQKGHAVSPEARAKLSAANKDGLFVRPAEVHLIKPILDRHRATRPEPATSPATPGPAVELGSDGRSALFRGVREELSPAEFKAVQLLTERYPRTYDAKEMNRAYGVSKPNTGWRTLAQRLKGRGEHVDSSIYFPADWRRIGRRGGVGIAPM